MAASADDGETAAVVVLRLLQLKPNQSDAVVSKVIGVAAASSSAAAVCCK